LAARADGCNQDDFNVLDYGVLVGRILVVPNLASGK
jgi:hypothetical protein